MGWNDRGKRGIHHGRTVRYDERKAHQELIIKHYKNTTSFSDKEKESHLESKYGIHDSFDSPEAFLQSRRDQWNLGARNRAGHSMEVSLALGKKKRWELPKLVQERLEEDYFDEEYEHESDELSVCFATRHVHDCFSRSTNCVSVFTDKDGGKTLSPKKTYSTKEGIEGGSDEPQICYELCQAAPLTSWPNNKERHWRYRPYNSIHYSARSKNKALCKDKGSKNKGQRWGGYTERDIQQFAGERGYSSFTRKTRKQKKANLITKKAFQRINKKMDSSDRRGTSFSLGEYVHSLLNQEVHVAMETNKVESSCIVPVTYGKGCAVYVEKLTQEVTAQAPPVSVPQLYEQEKKLTNEVNISRQELEPAHLQHEWGELYVEGGSFPRKFLIDVSPLLPKPQHLLCKVLFEASGAPLNGCTVAPLAVSIVPVVTGDQGSLVISALESVANDFKARLQKNTKAKDCLGLRDIVDIATACVSSKVLVPVSKASKRRLRILSLFDSMLGCQSESFTVTEAKREIETALCRSKRNDALGSLERNWEVVPKECEICFSDFEDPSLTTIKACGHSFCNACWEAHLKIQIMSGRSHILCPAHKCEGAVDDVTVMSLVPSFYARFLTKKLDTALEISNEWKWCPGNGCKMLVKSSGQLKSLATVMCACSTVWCFSCRYKTHWPASCKDAKRFYDIAGAYENTFLRETPDKLITSVMVKDCPKCQYPIEKHHGCNYMYCIMCQTAFCWHCRTAFGKDSHECKNKENAKEVDIPLNTKHKTNRFKKFFQIVEKNTSARHSYKLFAKEKKAKSLAKGVLSYKVAKSRVAQLSGGFSVAAQIMEKMLASNVSDLVQKGLEFSFQAHITLEGCAKRAAVRKASHAVIYTMSQLQFVVDRVDELCDKPGKMCSVGLEAWLVRLIEIGQGCVLTLTKF